MKDFIKKHKWEVPLYMIAAGLPLIVQFHIQFTGLEHEPWFPNQNTWSDFFLYGKSRYIHIMALVMTLLLFVGMIRKRNLKFEKEWLLVLGLGCLQLISACFSKYPERSFLGSIEQYESVWVLLGYLIIGVYSYQCVLRTEDYKIIFGMLFVGATLSCLLGLTQLFQMDFWATDAGKQILVPESMAELRQNLRFNFSINSWGQVHLASYNPNYAAIYLLMILPVLIFWKNKTIRMLSIPVLLCLLGTLSKTALSAAMILVILGIILFKNSIPKKKQKGLAIITVLGTGLLIGGLIVFNVDSLNLTSAEKLQQVICENDHIKIIYQDETLEFRFEQTKDGSQPYSLTYEDGSSVRMDWNEAEGTMVPIDENLDGLIFRVYEKNGQYYGMFYYQRIPFWFIKNADEGYQYVTINGKVDELKNAEALWNGSEGALNGRGYLWARVLPIIMRNPFVGTGPDSFIEVFPHDDYVVRANLGYEFFTQIITNAHNLYLQIAVQNGIPALICFVIFVVIYYKKSWKLYFGKTEYSNEERLGAAIFLSTIGYMLCGITFASSICTTPVFWLLLGSGMGINRKIRTKY